MDEQMTTIHDALTGLTTHRPLTAEELEAIFRVDEPTDELIIEPPAE